MHELTSILLNQLKEVKSYDDLLFSITNKQQEIKNQLLATGLQFFPTESQFSEEIVGGQIISGEKNVYLVHFYEEVNYIRHGLAYGWYTNLDRIDRYASIRKKIEEINLK